MAKPLSQTNCNTLGDFPTEGLSSSPNPLGTRWKIGKVPILMDQPDRGLVLANKSGSDFMGNKIEQLYKDAQHLMYSSDFITMKSEPDLTPTSPPWCNHAFF